ncbi:inner membrane protein YqiJ [Maritalea myrionectae]|uniref:Inner membrane protein YqiJ n=1 Tax=Maritalea myrionectae TaxID=454601 RepID=A0A2R4MJ19_9HYPH|nr:YqiJ family protein [Maritalea myrionectae]AVX05906.1 inner membrane protein YqiJ [Maritalea myrionectae]
MFEFIFSAANVPFGVALAIVFFIALLEGVGALFGAGLSQFVDSMLPEMDFDLDIAGPEIESPGIFVQFLSWLRFGQVPFIILLIVILTLFGLIGFALQGFVAETFGAPLPAWIAAPLAGVASLPLIRGCAGFLNRIMPRDETDAISRTELVGHHGVITLGRAEPGSPAQARIKDALGNSHYVMVEPYEGEHALEQGDQITLLRQDETRFVAMKNQTEN